MTGDRYGTWLQFVLATCSASRENQPQASQFHPKPLSYLLTSDEHMNYVAEQQANSSKRKCRNYKSVVAPDNKKVKQSKSGAQRCGRKPSKSKDSTNLILLIFV